jgi:hypothetical protein
LGLKTGMVGRQQLRTKGGRLWVSSGTMTTHVSGHTKAEKLEGVFPSPV